MLKRSLPATFLLVLICLLWGRTAAFAAETEKLLVQYEDGYKTTLIAQLETNGAIIRHQFDESNVLAITLATTDKRAALKMQGMTQMTADTPVYPLAQNLSWGVIQTGVPNVWQYTDGSGVRVCIIDTGIDPTHEDIIYTNIVNGFSGVGGENWYEDRQVHGSMVAGIIAGANNDVGYVGIAPGVELLIFDIFPDNGTAAVASDVLVGARWCAQNGANIINMSLGASTSGVLNDSYNLLYDNNVLLVSAAGNEGTESDTEDDYAYPASYEGVISVGSADTDLTHAIESRENDQIELAAPGVLVPSSSTSDVSDKNEYEANLVEAADQAGTYTATLVDGGDCNTSPAVNAWAGQIVLCLRGTETFRTKIDNVTVGGGIATVLYNNNPGNFRGSYVDCCAAIPAVSLTQSDGLALQTFVDEKVTVLLTDTFASVYVNDISYLVGRGTSFAAPYVAGVAALLWSICPQLTNDQVRAHISHTAQDIGTAGRDISFGWGFVQAEDAVLALYDGVDTYGRPNSDGSRPANVECPTGSLPATATPAPTDTPTITPTPTNTATPTNTPTPTSTSTPTPTATPTEVVIPLAVGVRAADTARSPYWFLIAIAVLGCTLPLMLKRQR